MIFVIIQDSSIVMDENIVCVFLQHCSANVNVCDSYSPCQWVSTIIDIALIRYQWYQIFQSWQFQRCLRFHLIALSPIRDWMNAGISGGDGESDTDFPDSLDLVSSWPNLKISIEADPIIISVNLGWVGGQNHLESKHWKDHSAAKMYDVVRFNAPCVVYVFSKNIISCPYENLNSAS